MAAKYNDGLLLDADAKPQTAPDALSVKNPATPQTVTIPKAGIYQVDLYVPAGTAEPAAPDASHLTEGLAGTWTLDGAGPNPGTLAGKAGYEDSPLGKAIAFDSEPDSLSIPRADSMNVGTGDFTASALGAAQRSAARRRTHLSRPGYQRRRYRIHAILALLSRLVSGNR